MTQAETSDSGAQAIVHRMACYDFPWDMTRSLELALFRTYCSPRISGLLASTGEFERYNCNYERSHFRYSDSNRRIGRSDARIVRLVVPAPAAPAGATRYLCFAGTAAV